MEIDDEHKRLLKSLGLKEKDFERFDGTTVTYELDSVKGVRLYDPGYETSYNEYIDIDGWSAWSSQHNTFMGDILKGTREEVERREKMDLKPCQEAFEGFLERKFGKKTESGPE